MAEPVLYVVLFLAIFFEVFALLTFVSRDARLRREKKRLGDGFPTVAVVVPCWNEESTIDGTVRSLLALDYPKELLEIILVNDGSADGTYRVMEEYATHPGVTVIHKENGGKHSAVNAGIARTNAEFVGCLDADSFVHPGALREIIPHFDDESVAAVTASMTVHEPHNILQKMQYAEYLAGVAMRHIFAALNGLYVTPGPFSFYRRSILTVVGGFRHGHQTEDMEMAMRLQKHGYRIENAPRAQVFTKAPHTLWGLIKQRTRWTSGFMRNAYDYRTLMFNPRYGVLGLMVLPFGVLAIVFGLGIFALTAFDTSRSIVSAIATKGDVPMTYVLSSVTLSADWFYLPITSLVLLGAAGLIAAVVTMRIGKQISGATRRLGFDVFWYIALYSLIAPLWLMRSVRDVAFGYNRTWR